MSLPFPEKIPPRPIIDPEKQLELYRLVSEKYTKEASPPSDIFEFEQEFRCEFRPDPEGSDTVRRDIHEVVDIPESVPRNSTAVRVTAEEPISAGDPVIQVSPKLQLIAINWFIERSDANYTLKFQFRFSHGGPTLTGKSSVTNGTFANIREIFNNWPGEYYATIDGELNVSIINSDDIVIGRTNLDEFGVEDERAGMIHPVDPVNILSSPHVRGIARPNRLMYTTPAIAMNEVLGHYNSRNGVDLYGESAVAPLRKQRYPEMTCALCEEHIHEPENLSEFLGPRQTRKYLEFCKQTDQKPMLYCCDCFEFIEKHPKILEEYKRMMDAYHAFRKAESEARKSLK